MERTVTRRNLLASTAGGLIVMPQILIAQSQDSPPPLPDDLVRDFVGAAHGQFDKVKEMLAANPILLNATWDWRNGDFESAMGAAAHMGNREIALHLIEKGARTDLFVHAMLGHLDIVKPILTRHPAMIDCKGAHGIPLIRHAERGGEDAKEVLDFLKTIQKL